MRADTLAQPPDWTFETASERYHVAEWSDGYFAVGEDGCMAADVDRDGQRRIVIEQVVSRLRTEGIRPPMVVRFQDIIKTRVEQLNEAFRQAREEFGYQAGYRGVYPIKVNQLHEVVDEILEAGRPFGMGLECGSKAELIAAMPYLREDNAFLLCNGYKDESMFDLILTGQQLGKAVLPVIEKYDEFVRFMRAAAARGVRPRFGVRIRLATAGSGKWADSGGDLSKFGVSIPELLRMLNHLKTEGQEDGFRLLHFHLGSQISDIQSLRSGIKEITRIYTQLVSRDIPIEYLDVGGGLGVNYEADLSMSEGINYTLQEYANAVVSTVAAVCTAEGTPHPTLVSESGRALAAHHSVLIVDVLSSHRKDTVPEGYTPGESDHELVRALHETLNWLESSGTELRPAELLEAFHDAVAKRREAESLFTFGFLSLEEKGRAEQLYWSACHRINDLLRPHQAEWLPAELESLDEHLVDQYLCDFSVFQSILDHWAFGQRFPIVPLSRLNEEPTRRAVLVDLTCDSDGKVRRYVSANDDKRFLDVHELRPGEPYQLGFFLMGAYQDIMGDMHNLFGRVAEVHVYADEEEPDGFYIEKVIPGTRVEEILALVQYFPEDLRKRMEKLLLTEVRNGKLRRVEAVRLLARYTEMFQEATYLDSSQGPHVEGQS